MSYFRSHSFDATVSSVSSKIWVTSSLLPIATYIYDPSLMRFDYQMGQWGPSKLHWLPEVLFTKSNQVNLALKINFGSTEFDPLLNLLGYSIHSASELKN